MQRTPDGAFVKDVPWRYTNILSCERKEVNDV
nr:MAG TPA: hypothetical protein [Bacteriophage sp.]